LRTGATSIARGLLGALGFLIPITLVAAFFILDKLAEITARLASRAYHALMDESRKEGVRIVFGILALVGLAVLSWTLLGNAWLAIAFLGVLAACLVAMGQEAAPA
jgi:hypothetical protein